jgi:FtsH-binding integral membrane protein
VTPRFNHDSCPHSVSGPTLGISVAIIASIQIWALSKQGLAAWTNGPWTAIIAPQALHWRSDLKMANPNLGGFNRAGTITDQAAYDVGLRTHMTRVYNYMASGLALSGIVAYGLFASNDLASLFFQVEGGYVVGLNILGWVAIFAPLGLLMLVSFRAATMSVGAVQAIYWAVTALMGVSLSLLLFRYTGASVARTFFVTAAAFGALSLYGYTTKRDLTAMGKFLFMGVIGLILAGIVNMIWPSGAMSFIISAAGVLIFSGLIAYDTQKIKEQYAEAWGSDTAEKVAIFGALSLYLDFVNLFQFLMMFLGQRR